MSSTSHKVSRLPVGEVKPLKKSNSLTALILSPDSQNEASADKQETEESSSHSNILFTSSASMDELATIGDHNMERKTNKTTNNKATVKARLMTLPRANNTSHLPETHSRIPRVRQLRRTFVPIDKPLSKRPSADCKKRTGTPLQELDRKWALEQCEELTTWTNDLLKARGHKLSQDLRKSISDGVTLPLILDVAFGYQLKPTKKLLSDSDRLQVLAGCLKYLTSRQLCVDITPEELLTGDLKAVLSLLSDVREKMGQGKSKSKAHATADQTKLLPYDVIKLDVDSEQVGESQFQIEESQMSQNGVLITHSQPIARQRQHPIKVLTTFQGPQISQEPQRSGSITKSAMNGSLSLDDIDKQVANGQQTFYHMRVSTSSSVSINVDSGELEYNDDDNSNFIHTVPESHCNYKELGLVDMTNSSDVSKEQSAFSSFHAPRQRQAKTKMVRGQPSGESNPTTPSVKDKSDSLRLRDAETSNHSKSRGGRGRQLKKQREANERHTPTPVQKPKNSKSKRKDRHISTSSERSPSDHTPTNLPHYKPRTKRSAGSKTTSLDEKPTKSSLKDNSKPDSRGHSKSQSSPHPLPAFLPLMMTDFNENIFQTSEEIEGIFAEKIRYLSTSTNSTLTPPPAVENWAYNNGADYQGTRAKEYEVPQDYYQAIPIENTEPMSRSSQHTEKYKKDNEEQANSRFSDLSDVKLRRLSMPNGYQYTDSSETRHDRKKVRERQDMWADNCCTEEQWIDGPAYTQHEDNTLKRNNQDLSALDGASLNDSIYNTNHFDDRCRPTTPSLPALTDNTDIESVSEALHTRRYQRSASFSDRIQFVAESSKGNDDESFSQPIEASPQTKPANDKPPEAAGVEGDFKSVREERAKLGERKLSVSESVTSSQGSYSGRYKASRKGKSSRTVDNRASHKKIQKIESHIITLAQSVAHISSEMKSNSAIYLQLESLSAEISSIKQILEAAGLLEPLTEVKDKLSQKTDNSLIDNKAQKLNKLTKFFGQEPPLMRLFLKDLGYEKYSTMFENEKIGLLELPYMTEEALKSIGIPLGPRTRILQEARTINQTSKTQPPVRNGHANNLSSVNKLSSHSSLASKPPIHSKSKKKSRKEHSNQ